MIDQHFPDAPYITFDKFDAREQVRKCVDAHIDSIHITTKCHHGYYYYNTEIGIKHPALGNRDQVEELITCSREAGLEAVAYTCIQFDNNAVRSHPEWSMMTVDDNPKVLLDNYRWNMPCINTGYRQEFLDHVREVIDNYDFDALMLDIFGMSFFWDRQLGGGTCVYLAAPLSIYTKDKAMYWPVRFIEGVINYLGVDAGISVKGPKGILEGTYFLQENSLNVHLLNQSVRVTAGEILPLHDVKIRVARKTFMVHSAQIVYPAQQSLPLREFTDYVETGIPEITIHTIVVFKLDDY